MRSKIVLAIVFLLGALIASVQSTSAQVGPFRSVLLDTVTAGTGQVDASPFSELTFYLTSVGTTSGGTVSLEEADWNPSGGTPYTGTWSVITTVNASTFTGGTQIAYHVAAPGAFGFIRARISSAITGGGTVSVTLRAK
jgi:hypothetical protein